MPPLNLPQDDAGRPAGLWPTARGYGAVAGLGRPELVEELVAALEGIIDFYVDVDAGYSSLTERALVEHAAAVLERARREGGRP